jgi:hypothetical protein
MRGERERQRDVGGKRLYLFPALKPVLSLFLSLSLSLLLSLSTSLRNIEKLAEREKDTSM